MTSKERIELVSDLRNKVSSEEGNVLTLLCLLALMTDDELIEFHSQTIKTSENKNEQK